MQTSFWQFPIYSMQLLIAVTVLFCSNPALKAQTLFKKEVLHKVSYGEFQNSFAAFAAKGEIIYSDQFFRNGNDLPRSGVLVTTDNGKKWSTVSSIESGVDNALIVTSISPIQIFSEQQVLGISMVTASAYGVTIPQKSSIVFTEDGGVNWKSMLDSKEPAKQFDQHIITRLTALNQKEFFALEHNKIFDRKSASGDIKTTTFLKSTDAGATWNRNSMPEIMGNAEEFRVINSRIIYAYSKDKSSGTINSICKSIDGGLTWTLLLLPIASANIIRDIHFFNENEGIAVGGKINSGSNPRSGQGQDAEYSQLIYRTQDGGLSWQLRMPETEGKPLYHIDIVNDTLAIVRSGYHAFATFNKGENWQDLPLLQDKTKQVIVSSGIDQATQTYLFSWHNSVQQELVRLTPNSIPGIGATSVEFDNSPSENRIDLFPNPAESFLTLVSSDSELGKSISRAKILNSLGEIALDINTNQISQIDISMLTSGIYYLNATFNNGNTRIIPFVVKR
jgi:photosystem II stability/assembly factor-like uncharacterized protein